MTQTRRAPYPTTVSLAPLLGLLFLASTGCPLTSDDDTTPESSPTPTATAAPSATPANATPSPGPDLTATPSNATSTPSAAATPTPSAEATPLPSTPTPPVAATPTPASEPTPTPFPTPVPVNPSEAGAFTTHIPSDVAPDGGIVVRVFYPAQADSRFEDGAPVVVFIDGGWATGDLEPETAQPDVAQWGFIRIDYLLPGGHDATGGKSGGTYDYRGMNCLEATRDVMRYAGGELADFDGKTLPERVSYALTSNLGVAAFSNGGNLGLGTLAQFGSSLPPLSWFMAWESPVGDQYAAVELNNNPFYTPGSCTVLTCPQPDIETELRLDPNATTSLVLLDQTTVQVPGALYLDENGNGRLDNDGSEKVFGPVSGPGDDPDHPKGYVSVELSDILVANGPTVFGDSPPPLWLARPDEIDDFWALRDGARNILAAHDAFPDILVMHLGSQNDHVQDQPDYPHARSHVQGWLDAGQPWVRLNPDSVYMSLVTGLDASNFPDNDANTAVQWPNTVDEMEPENVDKVAIDSFLYLAGLLELTDRAYYDNLSANVDEIVTSGKIPPGFTKSGRR